jgi:AcrR family transcriptional regulator
MPNQLHSLAKTKLDPRVVRTRHLLLDSFSTLLSKHQSIRKISIQSITDQAGVNRATFYAHFRDKYELLAVWKREMFRQSLSDKLPENQAVESISFEQLIDTVLEFKLSYRRYFKRINKEFEPLFEAVIQQELTAILVRILEKTPLYQKSVSREETATFLSWAIFGSADEWSRQQKSKPKEQISLEIALLVKKIVAV